jgi:transcriptional regulator with XRE-family HTH domain
MANSADESPVIQRFYRARSLDGLASAVAGARAARHLTQEDLGRAIGSSRPTISRLERGIATGADTVLDALAACGYELVVVPRGATVTVTP